MALQTLSVLPELDLPEQQAEIAPFATSARMEFQAALQLLAERAAFVTAATGVAIALEEQGSFLYRVAAGSEVAEPETAVDAADETSHRCLHAAAPVRVSGKQFNLLAAVRRNERPVGFMQVVSAYELSDSDSDTISRLADLAGVVLEHLEAAEAADARFWERLQEPLAPKQWHAPERPVESVNQETARNHPSAEVHLCGGCGFPVSPGRKLCVECEQKPDGAMAAPVELFATQSQPSWFAEHGYTVASLIVSALAAAVIFWLRR